MAINYVLIDLENTQPENLNLLAGKPFKVLVFMGEHPKKIPTDFLLALKDLGANWDCIQMSGSGPNALDFHIAYYLGKLAIENPDGHFFIVSKDKGFDPLLRHITAKAQGGIKARRIKTLEALHNMPIKPAEPPDAKPAPIDLEEKLETLIGNFAARGSSLPRTTKTLANTINSIFRKKLPKWEVLALVHALKERRIVQVEGKRLVYALPHAAPRGNGSPAKAPNIPSEKQSVVEVQGEQLLLGDYTP